MEELTEMERRITLEAPAIETGILAMERVHDVDNQLILAQSRLSDISSLLKHTKVSPVNNLALAASGHVDQAHIVVKRLVRRSKMKQLMRNRVIVATLLTQAAEPYREEAARMKVRIKVECVDSLQLYLDSEMMLRVLQNLIDNSLHFLETDTKGKQKQIRLSASRVAGSARIQCWDNGPGIEPEKLERVFDYFYTTRGDRGMGFGLAISRRTVIAHGGTIAVTSHWGHDTTFTIMIPTNR